MAWGRLGPAGWLVAIALVVAGVWTGLAAAQSGNPVPVETCRTIWEPGSYQLVQDVEAQTSPCLDVRASDVALDGAGFNLTTRTENTTGIAVRAEGSGPSNVTVHDVRIEGFGSAGLDVDGASEVLLDGVTARAADTASGAGVRVANAAGVTIQEGRLEANRIGLDVRGSSNVAVSRTSALSNGEDGYRFAASQGVDVLDSTASGNGAAGVSFEHVEEGTIRRADLRDNAIGALLEASPSARLADTSLRSSSELALEVHGGPVELDRIGFLGWEVTGGLEDVQLRRTAVGDPAPSPREALDLHLEVTPTTTGGFANLTAHYPSGVLAAYQEPTMRWWSWDGAAWNEAPGYNAVDTDVDTVTMNATRQGVYAPVVETDVVPPSTTVRAPAGWANATVEVVLEATDDASGVAETRYAGQNDSWQAYETPIQIATEGVHEVSYRSIDQAGNEEPVQNATVRIDRTPPLTRASLDASEPVDPASNVSLGTQDVLSGVNATRYRLDEGAWRIYEAPIDDLEPGNHTLVFNSWDRAGNHEATRSLEFEVLDPEGSAGSGTGGGGGGSQGPIEMLVQEESGESEEGEWAEVAVFNASRPDRTSLVLVHPDGDEEHLTSGTSAVWHLGEYRNGEYVIEARQQQEDGSHVTLASTPYLLENARATVGDALLAVATGAAVFVLAHGSGAVAGRLVRWLRYLVKTIRRALGIEYRERTKEHTSLRERLKREGGAVLAAAAVLATVATLGGIPDWILASFLEKLPLLGGAAVVFSLVWYGGDWVLARLTGQRPRYVLLGAGLVSLVVSTALFRSPFGTPGYVDKRAEGVLAQREEERFLAHRTLADLGLVAAAGLVFWPALRWGAYAFGEAGLFLVVMTLATGTLPVPPLPNHSVWRWNKAIALATFAAGVGLYVAWQLALLPDAGVLAMGGLGLAAVLAFALHHADPGAEAAAREA